MEFQFITHPSEIPREPPAGALVNISPWQWGAEGTDHQGVRLVNQLIPRRAATPHRG